MKINLLTEKIIHCAITVHKELGPGLLESSYQHALQNELQIAQLNVEFEKPMPLIYKNTNLEVGYRVDLLVEKQVVIEIKSVEALNDVHLAQVLTYLKLSGCKVGLLMNFNVSLLKNGLRRVIL